MDFGAVSFVKEYTSPSLFGFGPTVRYEGRLVRALRRGERCAIPAAADAQGGAFASAVAPERRRVGADWHVAQRGGGHARRLRSTPRGAVGAGGCRRRSCGRRRRLLSLAPGAASPPPQPDTRAQDAACGWTALACASGAWPSCMRVGHHLLLASAVSAAASPLPGSTRCVASAAFPAVTRERLAAEAKQRIFCAVRRCGARFDDCSCSATSHGRVMWMWGCDVVWLGVGCCGGRASFEAEKTGIGSCYEASARYSAVKGG